MQRCEINSQCHLTHQCCHPDLNTCAQWAFCSHPTPKCSSHSDCVQACCGAGGFCTSEECDPSFSQSTLFLVLAVFFGLLLVGVLAVLACGCRQHRTKRKEASYFDSPRLSSRASSRANSAFTQPKPCSVATEYVDHNHLGEDAPHRFEKTKMVELKATKLFQGNY